MQTLQVKAKMSANDARPGECCCVGVGVVIVIIHMAAWVGVVLIFLTGTSPTATMSTVLSSTNVMLGTCESPSSSVTCGIIICSIPSWRSTVESSWNITLEWGDWVKCTAGGRAPALSFVVSLSTVNVLCLTGRYLSTNSFIATSIGESILAAVGGFINSTSSNSILDVGTG